jgi:hypothetical protein
MLLASNADHFMAVVEKLRTAGLTVGEGWGRSNTTAELSPPYVTVMTTSSPGRRGPAGAPFDDSRIEFQTTCVATSARGAELLRDTVAAALLSGITVTGRSTTVWSDLEVGVNRDPDVDTLFTGIDRWTVWSTPKPAQA